MSVEIHELRPASDLVVKFTKPMAVADLIEWSDQMSENFPDRRVILVDRDTEVRLEGRSQRTTHRLLAAAILVFVIDMAIRALA